MLKIVETYAKRSMAVMITAIIFVLATNARAEEFDYVSAMKKAEKEINAKNYIQAFNTIKEIGKNAYHQNNPYGKYLFRNATAKLYFDQGDNAMAEKNYRMAIETAESSLPNIDTGDDYLGLARCLDKLTRRSEGIDLLNKGINKVNTDKSRAQLYVQLGKMLYWEKRYDDYINNYNNAKKYFGREINSDQSSFMTVIKELISGNTEQAEKEAMSIKSWENRNGALREVYVATGNYRKAYSIFLERASRLEAKALDEGESYHIAEMDADIIKSNLKLSRLKLEYDMAQQKIKMTKEQKLLDASKHENIKIKLANDSQLIAKMRADSLVNSAEAEERDAQYQMLLAMGKRHRITMYFGIALFVLVFAYGVFAWFSNKMVIRRLKKKQQLLTEALDKAQETERMKTAFVDNLGYEVKTPMNKILGLVENALSRIEELSGEEKEQIENEITKTADGLTATLNDVLKNSLAESGKKLSMIIVVMMTIATSMISNHASAQTVSDKLDKALFPLYQKAQNNRDLPEGLNYAKELYSLGEKNNDKYAQCVAVNVMLQHYVLNDNFEMIKTTAKQLREMAKACGDKQMYYLSYSNEINGYLNKHQSLTAQKLANELMNESKEKKDRMGQYVATKTLGDVQRVRRFYKNAIHLYLDAYVIYLKNQLNSDPTSMLINLCKLYRQEGEYDEASHYLNEAERHCRILRSHYRINIERARIAFETNNKPEFMRLYSEIRKMKSENGFRYPYEERLLEMMSMLFDGKRSEALERAKQELTDEGYLRLAEQDCAHNGEWKDACEIFQGEVVLYRNKMKAVFEADRKEMSDIAGNNLLEAKNIEMKLASANLSIEQLRQQNELARFQQDRHKLMMDNNALLINRMKSEQKLASAKGKSKEAVMKMQKEQSELNRRFSLLSIVLAIVVTLFLASYLWHSHKSKKRLREKNEELNAAIRKAQESEKMKSTFIQNMSHEIRTPLNAIVGFSKLLLSDSNELASEEKEEFINIIRRNEDLLKQLIDDVMSLHDLHSGEYKMSYSLVSANKLCHTSIETVKHRAKPDAPIIFTTNVEDDFTFITDGMRAAQVIINFLTNAIKYTEEGNIKVDCSYDSSNHMLTISVADTGCGIPKNKQQEIFERFAKLDSFHQGTGLGLNICHVISQRLGGKVGIDPDYDKGARFFLTLPVKDAE